MAIHLIYLDDDFWSWNKKIGIVDNLLNKTILKIDLKEFELEHFSSDKYDFVDIENGSIHKKLWNVIVKRFNIKDPKRISLNFEEIEKTYFQEGVKNKKTFFENFLFNFNEGDKISVIGDIEREEGSVFDNFINTLKESKISTSGIIKYNFPFHPRRVLEIFGGFKIKANRFQSEKVKRFSKIYVYSQNPTFLEDCNKNFSEIFEKSDSEFQKNILSNWEEGSSINLHKVLETGEMKIVSIPIKKPRVPLYEIRGFLDWKEDDLI